MTKLVTLTDKDGDEFAVPIADIVMVSVANATDTPIIGRITRSHVLTRTGFRVDVLQTVAEIAAKVNAL